MLKVIVSAVWICIITLVSSYVAASWKANVAAPSDNKEALTGLNYQKTEPINVPIIADGMVKGYVVAQFVYTADAGMLNKLSVPPDAFILDAAFRTIYDDDRIDIDHLDRFDLASLTTKLKETANTRFGIDLLQDVLVQQFTFVSKDEVRAQAGASGGGPVLSADSALANGAGDAAADSKADAKPADGATKPADSHE